MQYDEQFMARCIRLAENGLGFTYPNPMVGSIIVYKGEIIGEGWHQKAGEPHAEVMAIRAVKDESVLPESTLYVNLEPCSHFGRTPPCSDLIVKKKIGRVVIGTIDPNSEINGKGIAHLKKNGCEVKLGVLEAACRDLNKRFFTYHGKKRPFVILKWAQTADGFIAPDYKDVNRKKPEPVWITNKFSLQYAHMLRAIEQSILVGKKTAMADNPGLDARLIYGDNPLRLLIDRDLEVKDGFKLLNEKVRTVVFNAKTDRTKSENLEYIKIDFQHSVPRQVLEYLYAREIQSVIIEGGAFTLNAFIKEDLWDEAFVFTGKKVFQKGLEAPKIRGRLLRSIDLKGDKLMIYKND